MQKEQEKKINEKRTKSIKYQYEFLTMKKRHKTVADMRRLHAELLVGVVGVEWQCLLSSADSPLEGHLS